MNAFFGMKSYEIFLGVLKSSCTTASQQHEKIFILAPHVGYIDFNRLRERQSIVEHEKNLFDAFFL